MGKNGKIFLVDDEKLIVMGLSMALRKEGYEVESETERFIDVADRIRSSAPAVVLLDISLPEMSGIDILKNIRSGKIDTEVVMLTADDATETAIKCMKLGAAGYLTKPFNVDEVLMAVKNIIEKEELRHEANRLRNKLNDLGGKTGNSAFASISESIDRFEESFARISQHTVALSHELRTPINNLMGEAEVALSKHRTPDEYRQVLASSLEEYVKLSGAVDDLLFLIRVENPKAGIQPSRFDALEQIQAVEEFYQPVAEKKGIEMKCGGSGSLIADQSLFRKAVSSLLSDALSHTPDGGKIDISVHRPDDQSVEVTVCMSAPEFDPGHRSSPLDRFNLANDPDCLRGTFLGLSIARSIMRLHYGDITLKHDPEKGLVVSLLFPLRQTSGSDLGEDPPSITIM